jgi:hypothetical protein
VDDEAVAAHESGHGDAHREDAVGLRDRRLATRQEACDALGRGACRRPGGPSLRRHPQRQRARPGRTARPRFPRQTVTKASPLCAAVIPSSTAFTDFQLFSASMRASQPCTYACREVAADRLAQREQPGAEVVCDGDRITAHIVVPGAEDVIVQDLQPLPGALLGPLRLPQRVRSARGHHRLASTWRDWSVPLSWAWWTRPTAPPRAPAWALWLPAPTSWFPTATAPRCCSRPACPSCATTSDSRSCARGSAWWSSGWPRAGGPDCVDEVPYDFCAACVDVAQLPKDEVGF